MLLNSDAKDVNNKLVLWDQTKVIDRANTQDVLRFKEALHIQTSDGHFNRDVGTDIPQCWPALLNLNS